MTAERKEKFYLRVYQLRVLSGMSQVELAMLLGIHPITVSKWERDCAKPNLWQKAVVHALAGSPEIKLVRSWIHQAGVIPALAFGLKHATGGKTVY